MEGREIFILFHSYWQGVSSGRASSFGHHTFKKGVNQRWSTFWCCKLDERGRASPRASIWALHCLQLARVYPGQAVGHLHVPISCAIWPAELSMSLKVWQQGRSNCRHCSSTTKFPEPQEPLQAGWQGCYGLHLFYGPRFEHPWYRPLRGSVEWRNNILSIKHDLWGKDEGSLVSLGKRRQKVGYKGSSNI